MVIFGELYLAKVYFKGTKGPFKQRPVLIVDDTEENLITFAEITSIEPTDPPKYYDNFKVEIPDWQAAGLKKISWVKCYKGNIHRVQRNKVLKKIGSVDLKVMTEVLEIIVNQK